MRYVLFSCAIFLFGMLPACSSAEEDLCDLKCECEGCNEVGYEVCLNEHDEDFRRADFRGCGELYDDLIACEDQTGVCRGADWDTACGPEKDRFKNCTDDK
jgi:hypothetical protein